jgi:hypothetical protein
MTLGKALGKSKFRRALLWALACSLILFLGSWAVREGQREVLKNEARSMVGEPTPPCLQLAKAAYLLGHSYIPSDTPQFRFNVVCDYADWLKLAGADHMTDPYLLNFSMKTISFNATALQPVSRNNGRIILLGFAKMANHSDDEQLAVDLVDIWAGKRDFNDWWFQMVQQLGG